MRISRRQKGPRSNALMLRRAKPDEKYELDRVALGGKYACMEMEVEGDRKDG